jgi:L-ribulose-5-phosphate 4-epimerase
MVSNLGKRLLTFAMGAKRESMLQRLREQVLEANLELVRGGLVLYTFGNASGISRDEGLVVIKPSGVPYKDMRPEHLVVTDLHGKVIEGHLRPSSDLPTHLVLYNQFPEIGGIAHTHSEYATAWAQARKPIPCFGTTHADYFHGEVPVTAEMTDTEIAGDYEKNTGDVIVRALQQTTPLATPGILVANHGPFAWGKDARTAAHNAAILESIARMAYFTLGINAAAQPVGSALHDKHYLRKHGTNAYYGQSKSK